MKKEVAEVLSAGTSAKYTAVGTSSIGLQLLLQNISLMLSIAVGLATLIYMIYGIVNRHHELKKNWARRKSDKKAFEEFVKERASDE